MTKIEHRKLHDIAKTKTASILIPHLAYFDAFNIKEISYVRSINIDTYNEMVNFDLLVIARSSNLSLEGEFINYVGVS